MIEVQNVSKSFGNVEAIKSVSLTVHKGERWGVIGHNGSGKSTLLKLMMGLSLPTEGVIKIAGKPVSHELRRNLGYVSQGESLDSTLNVFENLYFFGLYNGLSFKEARLRAENLLASVDIKANLTSAVENLSGGTRKKLQILRSYMLDPEILFMDEPSNQLDVHSQLWFNDLAEKMTNAGKTIILTSHDITEVENTCDHIAILFGGTVLACGKTSDILAKHISGSVVEYRIPGKAGLRDEELVRAHHGQIISGRCFLFPDKMLHLEGLIETIHSPSITVRAPTLKDLYIKLTHTDIS